MSKSVVVVVEKTHCETRHLKTQFATHSFALSMPTFSLVALLLNVWPVFIQIRALPPRAQSQRVKAMENARAPML